MTVILTGTLADITDSPVDEITRVTVKSPTWRTHGTDLTTSQPVPVEISPTGQFSINVVPGLGYLYVEGDSWSDSVPFVAAEGMTLMIEAVANATQSAVYGWVRELIAAMGAEAARKYAAEYIEAESQAIIAAAVQSGVNSTQQALTDAIANIDDAVQWHKAAVESGSLNLVVAPGAYPVSHTDVTDRPSVYYGTLEVFNPTSGRVIQKYTDTNTPPAEFVRIKTGNNPWSVWTKVGAHKPDIVSGSLNDILTPGIYPVSHTDVTDRPSVFYGSLDVTTMAGGRVVQKYTDAGNPPTEFVRVKVGANPWGAWETSSTNKPAVSSGSLNDVLTKGVYPVSHTAVTERPSIYYGTLEVFEPTGGRVIQKYTDTATPPVEYVRIKNGINDDFSEWTRTGAAAVANPDSFDPNVSRAATRKAMLVQELTARKGGRIGTGGLGAVALRFDDAHPEFVERALPVLSRLRLPFSRVTTTDSDGARPIAPEAFTEMQDYCIKWGGEVWNHGRTHKNATGRVNVYNELIAPLFELREKMPRIPIDCFAPPGGSVTYDGHMPSRTPENWYGNVVGQEVWSEHAIATGYMDHMLIRRLDGVVRDGARQWSADSFTLAFTQSIVSQLQNGGQGACLMWHMNAAGADFEAILRWIAAERDAGRLMVLTDSGLHCADASTDYRVNLLKTREFTGAAFTDVWTNTTGERWVERLQGYRGATVELVCEVTGTAGQTVTTNICGVEMTHTLTGGEQTIRQVATIPVDASEIRFSCDGSVTQAHCWHV